MIPPVLAAGAASAALGVASSVADAVAATQRNDELDRSDFLTLLVEQLKAQDPLNPMEGADFSAQLAQFSSLEQLMSINQRLELLAATGGGAGGADAVGFLGREVAVAGGELAVAGGERGSVAFSLAEAKAVTLQISDANGREVASVDLGNLEAGSHHVDLDALAGMPELVDGTYAVRLSARGASGDTQAIDARVFARVTGVDLSTNPPTLLVGDRRVALDEVAEVRALTEPPASEG